MKTLVILSIVGTANGFALTCKDAKTGLVATWRVTAKMAATLLNKLMLNRHHQLKGATISGNFEYCGIGSTYKIAATGEERARQTACYELTDWMGFGGEADDNKVMAADQFAAMSIGVQSAAERLFGMSAERKGFAAINAPIDVAINAETPTVEVPTAEVPTVEVPA